MGVTPFHKSNVLFVFYFHFYHCLFREGHQRRSVLDTHLASDHLRKNGTGWQSKNWSIFLMHYVSLQKIVSTQIVGL